MLSNLLGNLFTHFFNVVGYSEAVEYCARRRNAVPPALYNRRRLRKYKKKSHPSTVDRIHENFLG